MINTLDMQGLRYLNLFSSVTKVNTRYFFEYNNMLVFCVPKNLLSKSLGKEMENLKKINRITKRRIRIIAKPESISDARAFIEKIVSPMSFNSLEITNSEIIINAGKANKANLIGKDKKKLIEMQRIVKSFFNKEFRIV